MTGANDIDKVVLIVSAQDPTLKEGDLRPVKNTKGKKTSTRVQNQLVLEKTIVRRREAEVAPEAGPHQIRETEANVGSGPRQTTPGQVIIVQVLQACEETYKWT